jgi:hypothetical protein
MPTHLYFYFHLDLKPHVLLPLHQAPYASINDEFVRYMSAGTASCADPELESMGSVELVDYCEVCHIRFK